MKKLFGNNHAFVRKIILCMLSAVLSVFNASGQERREQGDIALENAKLLITENSKESSKASISPDTAIKILNKSLAIAKAHSRLKTTTASIWRTIAARTYQKGDVAGCMRYLDSAFALNEELKSVELTLELNDLAGQVYKRNTNYAKAASCYSRVIQALAQNKIDDELKVAKAYNNVAIFMLDLEEDSLARKYLLLARQHMLRMPHIDTAELINIYLILGNTYFETDSSVARSYFRDAYVMTEKYTDILMSNWVMENLCMGYILINQYDTAEYFLNIARATSPPGEPPIRLEMMAGVISYHKGKYAASERHLQNALKLIDDKDDGMLERIYNTLAEVYAARGDYQKAYTFQNKFVDQHDIRNSDARKIISDFMLNLQALENEKAILQKQAEISSHQSAIKKQRFWIAGMCLVSVLLGVILLMAYRNYRNKKSLLSQQMHTLVQEQEIDRLKAEAEGADNERTRIAYDLHDGVMVRLANAKINLNGLPVTHPEILDDVRFRDIVTQLDTASGELRNTAHNLMPEILLEDGVAQAIFYFCKTTEQASGLNIKFQQIGQQLPRLQIQVETAVYRIVQGLVQNVIQHAKATTALVQLQYAEHICSVTVEDNGQGINERAGEEGYGLKSIRNRVKILNGTFDIKSDKTAGTTAYLEFDVLPFMRKDA